jgi:hypothetical protein
MPSTGLFAILAAAACLGLAGCSSSSTLSHYTHATPEAAGMTANSAPDGIGPSAEAPEQAESRPAARAPSPAQSRASARAADISARAAARPAASDPTPFSEEWWTRENNADARLKRSMDICRGC